MPAGIQIVNPSGTLVVSSDAINYGLAGAPTLITAATKYHAYAAHLGIYYGDYTPATYEIVTNSSVFPPIFAALLSPTYFVTVGIPYLHSGTTWRCQVWCYAKGPDPVYPYDPAFIYTIQPATPTILCFTPYTGADAASGTFFEMYTASGVLSFSLARKPMWFKSVLDFTQISAYNSGGGSGDWGGNPEGVKQVRNWSAFTNPLVMNADAAGYNNGWSREGEDVWIGNYMWTSTSTTIERWRAIYRQEPRVQQEGQELTSAGGTASAEALRLFIMDGNRYL